MRLIDADKLTYRVRKTPHMPNGEVSELIYVLREDIDNAPTIDAISRAMANEMCKQCNKEIFNALADVRPKGEYDFQPKDKVRWAYMSKNGYLSYTTSYKDAVDMAKFDQPNYRPYYIVKATTHFDVVDVVRGEDE